MQLVSLFFLTVIGLDIQDDMGRHEVGHVDNTVKEPIDGGTGCRFESNFRINKARNIVLKFQKYHLTSTSLKSV